VQAAHSDVSKAQNQLGQYGDINALRKAAEAAVYDAKLNVGYCYVRAPYNGWVTNLNIAEGQYAKRRARVVSLIDDRKMVRDREFPRDISLAHTARMTAEFLFSPIHKRFRGRVQGVGWALFPGKTVRPCRGCRRRGDAQLGAAVAALSGADRARGSRPEISVQDGHHGGGDDPGLSRSGFTRAKHPLKCRLAKPEIRFAQTPGWFDQLAGLLSRELAPSSRKLRTAFALRRWARSAQV